MPAATSNRPVQVGKQYPPGVVQPRHAGLGRRVAHGAVRPLDQELVRQAIAHRDVQILEPVTVDVRHGDALVSHKVGTGDRVDPSVPVLAAPQQLEKAGRVGGQHRSRAVDERRGVAPDLLEALQTNPFDPRWVGGLPAHPLDLPGGRLLQQHPAFCGGLVAHPGYRPRAPVLDPHDLEDDTDLEIVEGPRQLRDGGEKR
jgi:hypothetical protein